MTSGGKKMRFSYVFPLLYLYLSTLEAAENSPKLLRDARNSAVRRPAQPKPSDLYPKRVIRPTHAILRPLPGDSWSPQKENRPHRKMPLLPLPS